MQTLKDHRPTQFDCSESDFLDSRDNWLVAPVIQTRDSGALELSNFDAASKLLGGESGTVEIHRFNHWGPGWYEIIIVNPDSPQAQIARDIEKRLEDYPLLDETDFSEREFEDFNQSWDCWGHYDFISLIQKSTELKPATIDFLENLAKDKTIKYWLDNSNIAYESEDSGVHIPFPDTFNRDQIAVFIRDCRR